MKLYIIVNWTRNGPVGVAKLAEEVNAALLDGDVEGPKVVIAALLLEAPLDISLLAAALKVTAGLDAGLEATAVLDISLLA